MWNLFNTEHLLGRILSRIVDLVLLNVVYVVCCLPLVTIGAATSALYYVTVRMAEGTDVRPLRDFWKGFRENFRGITPVWLVVFAYAVLLGAVFSLNGRKAWGAAHAGWIDIILIALAVLLVLMNEWLCVLQMRFDNTRRELVRNAALFTVRFLPSLFLLDAAHVLLLLFTLSMPRYWPLTFVFGFSAPAMIKGVYFSRIFAKVMAGLHPEAVTEGEAEDGEDAALSCDTE